MVGLLRGRMSLCVANEMFSQHSTFVRNCNKSKGPGVKTESFKRVYYILLLWIYLFCLHSLIQFVSAREKLG